jgi:hypothetical protein
MENTKVRDNLMDIKSLQVVTKYGLEKWKPVKKQISAAVSGSTGKFSTFKVPCPNFQKRVYL